MKISCDRDKLLDTFLVAQNITPRKTSKPILKNVKMEAFDKKVQITATNIELTMKRTIEVGAVGEDGVLLVSGKDMADILRETNSDEVFITLEDNTVVLKADNDVFRIQSNISEDFFNIDDIKEDFSIEIPREQLIEMISKTIFTTGKETMAYTFEGVLFYINEDKIELVGTDGKRIAIAKEKLAIKAKKENKALVPIPTLRILLTVLTLSSDENIKIKFCPNHIIFEDSQTELVSQLIEGRFPEYKNYIPSDYKVEGVFTKEEITAGIRKANIMTSQEAHLIRFNFIKDGMQLKMTSQCLDKGTSEVNITMSDYKAEENNFEIGFNGMHILDVLKVLDKDKVTWRIKDEQGPGEITEGDNFQYIFMPVKLR